MNNFRDLKISNLEQRFAILMSKYNATSKQLSLTLNEADKVNLGEILKGYEQEIQTLQEELEKAEKIQGEPNRRHLNVEEELSEFDFTETVEIFEKIIGKFDKNGGAALFLLQNSLSMGGERAIVRLRELLSKKTRRSKFHSHAIELSFREKNEIGLLRKLVHCFNLDSNPEYRERCTQDIIRKIHNSVPFPGSGHIIFIELKQCDLILNQEDTMSWLIKKFWVPLVKELPNTSKNHPYVKFVILMVTDIIIGKDFIINNCCKFEDFNPEKIVNLPLNKCELNEIEELLYSKFEYHPDDAANIARTVYIASEQGRPDYVYQKLMKMLVA